jgi:hypothetical protein
MCAKINGSELIREAYTNYYAPDHPPTKFRIYQKNSPDMVLMPYIGADGLAINKAMFIAKYQTNVQKKIFVTSVHPEMANLPDIGVARKI